MTDVISGGTTSASGVDVAAKAARVAQHYQKNPASPSGPTPTNAVILSADDDAASAAAKLLAANGSEGDADALAQVGASWSAIRSQIDAITNDAHLTPEGKAAKYGDAYSEAVTLVQQLRYDAAETGARADALEARVEDELSEYDDLGPEEKRALYTALQAMPGESLGSIFIKLCEKPIGEWRKHEGQRVIAVLKLHDAGALPAMPNYSMQIGWQALLAQSPHREHVEAARGRADLLARMAGSVESAAMKKAQATGNADALRAQLGLAAFQPGRLGKPEGVKALVLDIPASERDLARWGHGGRR